MTLNTIENTMYESVRETFSGFLGLDLETCEGAEGDRSDDTALSGCIPFKGSWRGCLVVTVSRRLVADAAGRCFGCPDPDDAFLADVTGEISNIVAGNFSLALPTDVELSIPIVVNGSDYKTGIPRGQVVRRFNYSAGSETICVTLMRRDED